MNDSMASNYRPPAEGGNQTMHPSCEQKRADHHQSSTGSPSHNFARVNRDGGGGGTTVARVCGGGGGEDGGGGINRLSFYESMF